MPKKAKVKETQPSEYLWRMLPNTEWTIFQAWKKEETCTYLCTIVNQQTLVKYSLVLFYFVFYFKLCWGKICTLLYIHWMFYTFAYKHIYYYYLPSSMTCIDVCLLSYLINEYLHNMYIHICCSKIVIHICDA